MPHVIVHTLAHARAALAACAETGLPTTLSSPPDAARSLGVGYCLSLAEMAGAADFVVDCGDAPGLALAALRGGARRVRVVAAPAVMVKLADIADQLGARIETQPPADILDLAAAYDPLTATCEFLRQCSKKMFKFSHNT
ncbi:MAG TPA: hypothetical protein VK558_01620 [Patescibacteria group bacterium]|nr:hypothetical protein [Patescibacteria group bacterium]